MIRKPIQVVVATVAIGLAALIAPPLAARQNPQGDALASTISAAAKGAQVSDPPATLVYANRPIIEFRATVLSRTPAARVAGAVDHLDRVVAQAVSGRVSTRAYDGAVLVNVDDQTAFAVTTADVDPLANEQLATKAADAAARLQVAFDEAIELRQPGRLLLGVLLAVAATLVYGAALWLLARLDRRIATHLSSAAERHLRRLPGSEITVGIAHAPAYVRRVYTLGSVILGLLLTYGWLTFVLRRFPYTRPWGESLRGALIATAVSTGRTALDALPGLLMVLAIVVITRFLARLTTLAFRAAEEGRIVLPWIYPETAMPTRRIVVACLWLFALIVSYEYLPGSESDAFKGVSVFVGLIVSLGSTGIMAQVMSGLMITYSRAVRRGDYVRIGDIEGTVTNLGPFSMKLRSVRNEDITIPNGIVVSHETTNYSRHASGDGVFAPVSLTIGYDVPWRQVHALLLLATDGVPGVRPEPKPLVLQTDLGDSCVQYTLLVCIERPERRNQVLAALRANIQDAFNEYGVQIMSPRYEADPSDPKVVPPSRWYAAPAAPPAGLAPDPSAANRADEKFVRGA